ncbi:uncharacterized protein A1O5_11796 [Cladophialophora psammophila CBS 110553]|uniref:Uncharacterized protein n=1 Tax=Cladophialophora psammophila CBS 110553 TaxID=1182543 RepID=W9W919_9EURO|nr:uncharacterized protein A1O5_11796 [Cladophialophora psammophila CBS 110553]EXJ61480.1 hypothetical protein A1O5_11796 [Cladophialophora psammophila CBS 110553]
MASEQLKTVTSTPNGHAIKDPLPDHPEFEEVTALKPSSTLLSKAWEDLKRNQCLLRSDMSLTVDEIGDPGADEERYLIVGYAFPKELNALRKKASFQKGEEPDGTVDPDKYVADWEKDNFPYYVVTRIITTNQNHSIQLYALLKCDESATFSTPFAVEQDNVFYRHEFRGLSTNARDRRSSWNELVAQHAIRCEEAVPTKAARPRRYHSEQRGNLMVQGGESLAPELCMLASLFHETKSPAYLEQKVQALHRAYPDLEQQAPPENAGLNAFYDKKAPGFSSADAQDVVEDMLAVEPTLEDLTADRVMALKKHLDSCGEEYEYRHVKLIIAGGMAAMKSIKSGKNSSFDSVQLIQLLKNVGKIFPSSTAGKPYCAPKEANTMLLTSLTYKLKELVDHWDHSCAQVRDSLGNTGLPGIGYEDMRGQLAEAVDAPALHLLLSQIARNVLAKYENILADGLVGPMRRITERLELYILSSEDTATDVKRHSRGKYQQREE